MPSNDDTAGLVIGDNLTSGPSDSTNPFKGMVAQRTGLKLFNTPIKMYDGNNLNVLIDRDSNDRNVFAIGASIDESTLAGADLKLAYDSTPGVETYVLTIDGNIDLSENVDFTISETDIMSAIDHFLPSTDMANVSQRGLYLTPGWLGFWEYDAANPGSAYWPVKIGATATGTSGDPFFEIKNHPTLPTEFIRYTTTNGLEIQGKINVQGDFPSIRYSNFNTNTQINSSGNTFVIANNISYENDESVYIAMRCRDAENGAALYWYNSWNTSEYGEPSPDVNGGIFLGNLDQGFVENNTNSFEKWFTFTVPVASLGNSGSNYGLIQTKNLGTDGIQLLDIIVYNGTEEYLNLNELKANITAGNAIPGNVNYTLTNDIILGNGSIQIGNTVNSSVFSAGTTDFNTNNSTPGFRLGNDNGAYKFLIKNNQNDDSETQQYINIDTSSSTNAIEIKGAIHADRLANTATMIKDASGEYHPLHWRGAQGNVNTANWVWSQSYLSSDLWNNGVEGGQRINYGRIRGGSEVKIILAFRPDNMTIGVQKLKMLVKFLPYTATSVSDQGYDYAGDAVSAISDGYVVLEPFGQNFDSNGSNYYSVGLTIGPMNWTNIPFYFQMPYDGLIAYRWRVEDNYQVTGHTHSVEVFSNTGTKAITRPGS